MVCMIRDARDMDLGCGRGNRKNEMTLDFEGRLSQQDLLAS